MRHRALSLSLGTLTFVTACAGSTDACTAGADIAGTWTYQANRETPTPGTIAGSLVIASSGCADFHGAMDVVETLATGESHRITGPISGTVDGTLVTFEATLSGGSREHLARLDGDSLSGSWIESSGTIPGSGEFGGHRQREP